jgi:hypothetical protein
MYITRDSEARNEIEKFETLQEAKKAIESYELDDRISGIFEKDFYEIYNDITEEII